MKPKKPTCPACHGPATESFYHGTVWCDAECDRDTEPTRAGQAAPGFTITTNKLTRPSTRAATQPLSPYFYGIPPVPYASNVPQPPSGACNLSTFALRYRHDWQVFAHPTAPDAQHCTLCGDVWWPGKP